MESSEPLHYINMQFFCIFLLVQQRCHPCHGFHGLVCVTESGHADIPFAAGAEACAGGGDHVGLLQQQVEELPAAHAIGVFAQT